MTRMQTRNLGILRSRNPAMQVLESEQAFGTTQTRTMTIGGTVTATGILLSIVAVVGVLVWQQMNAMWMNAQAMPGWAMPAVWGSLIVGVVLSFVIYAKPKAAPFLAPLHAVIEGAFVGVATFVIPMSFLGADPATGANPGAMIALQAIGATFAVTAAMLLGYATGVLRVGPLMAKIMMTALFGLVGYTFLIWILSFFGVGIWNGYADTGPIGIGFTILCAGLASLFLLLDFQYIEDGVSRRAPKYMEWVGAWGLMVTLVWLYIEMLRLLSKLNSNR